MFTQTDSSNDDDIFCLKIFNKCNRATNTNESYTDQKSINLSCTCNKNKPEVIIIGAVSQGLEKGIAEALGTIIDAFDITFVEHTMKARKIIEEEILSISSAFGRKDILVVEGIDTNNTFIEEYPLDFNKVLAPLLLHEDIYLPCEDIEYEFEDEEPYKEPNVHFYNLHRQSPTCYNKRYSATPWRKCISKHIQIHKQMIIIMYKLFEEYLVLISIFNQEEEEEI